METHTLDSSKAPLGRIASQAARLLMGKHRPTFQRHKVLPIRVIISHSDNIVLSGRKWKQKKYYRHSGFIGKLREFSAEELRDRDSRQILRHAVMGMLPKNKLRSRIIKNLIIHKGESPKA
ncbi:MAG: 50S ribosomal protein L13 [Patescibacteria group bacterium]